MPTLDDLLSDPSARIELIVKGQYLDENDVQQTEWISQNGWDDEVSGPVAAHIPDLLDIDLRINHQVEPLDPQSSFDVFGDIEISNNHLDHAGRYDSWWRYSVDDQDWLIYAVGYLSDGTRVELLDVLSTPLYRLKGINMPEVGSDTCTIRCRDYNTLSSPLQPVTYSPPALYFPGTVAGVVDLGDNLNITGTQSISAWIYLTDTISTTQYILFKDSGTTGYYVAVGLVGGGTIAAGVEVLVRGQSPTTTTTAANVLRPFQWHRIDIAIAATTRRIDIDGTTAITTSSITGTPLSSVTALTIGRSLLGRIHRVLYWTNTRTQAVMSAEGRVPITGTESSLREAFLFGEGKGTSVASIKSGSSLTGTLGTGVLWDSASWHYEAIAGQYEPYVLGTVPRVPVKWIDPPKQIGQVSRGSIALLSELQSNHNVVSSANYTVNLANGTITVTAGSLSGTYSATVTANNLWKSALLFNGSTSGATASVTMPAGAKYIGAHFRVDNIVTANRIIANWPGTGHRLSLSFNATGANVLQIQVVNDASVAFAAQVAVTKGVRYSALGTLDPANPSTGLRLYLNGVLVATTAISGAFTGTQATLSVGHLSTGPTLYFTGAIDEIIVGNIAATLDMAQDFHSLPVTSSFPGIFGGWHLDEATGTTAAPFVGAASLTLTNTTWTAGRSAMTDLARAILYEYGYTENDIDTASWLAALSDTVADCGWFVTGGASGIDLLNVICGGLGFIQYESAGLIKIRRFEGLSGVTEVELDYELDLQSQPVEPLAADPAIYLWTVLYATNNTRLDAANVAANPSTEADRYQYGQMESRSVSKSDGAVLDRFPSAETRTRTTALLYLYDAEAEAARLLTLHKHGADRKAIQAFLRVGNIEILSEIGPLMSEVGLDAGNVIATGVSIDGETGTITIWRPAI